MFNDQLEVLRCAGHKTIDSILGTHRKPWRDSRTSEQDRSDEQKLVQKGKLEVAQVVAGAIKCTIQADPLFAAPGDPHEISSAFVDVVRRPKPCLREK